MKVKLAPDLPPRRRLTLTLTSAARAMATALAVADKRASLSHELEWLIEEEYARRQPPKAQP